MAPKPASPSTPHPAPAPTKHADPRRAQIQKAHEANLAKLKPAQEARAKAAKAFPSAEPVHTDFRGFPTSHPRANTEVQKPDTMVLGAKGVAHSIRTDEGAKLAKVQNDARRKMIEDRIAHSNKSRTA
jgi:hypothetical protein